MSGTEEDATGPRASGEPRTVLEREIWQRRLTIERFAEFAEMFAREHGEPGTLSYRHLRRLVAGRGENGKPLGRVRPDTARLLERIFGTSIDVLLSAPDALGSTRPDPSNGDDELRQMLRTSARVDESLLELLRDQLAATRRLDRQLGGIVAHDEVLTKAGQVNNLLSHSITPGTRDRLAALLSELCTLAGWQALDMGDMSSAWKHYRHGTTAARETDDVAFAAHTMAGQALVLIDLGEVRSAVELLATIRERCDRKIDRLIRSWIAAAHGEALAADGQRTACLNTYDIAFALLSGDTTTANGPYVALDAVHLARWRGHALARLHDRNAVDVLTSALNQLDPTFTRAETALRVDLATALTAAGERDEARAHADLADTLAREIGSNRQRRRLRAITSESSRTPPRPVGRHI